MTLGVVMIVMTLIGWSSVPLFLKHFSHAIDPWTSNGWRYGFAAFMWAPVLLLAVARNRLPRGLWRAAVVPSVFNMLGQVFFTWAHYKIDPGLLTFGLRVQIVCVAAGAFLMFPSERRLIRSAGFLTGAAMVLAGTVGTALLTREATTPTHVVGVLMAIASGALFAAYALSVRKWMHGMHPVLAFSAISQYTAAGMIGLMLVFGARAGVTALDLSGGQFALLLFSAVIGIALGHVFYYTSIARLGVAVSSGVIQLQPFVVTAASAALFGERLTGGQLVSGVVAVCGAALILVTQHRLSRPGRPSAAPAIDEIEDQLPDQPASPPARGTEPAAGEMPVPVR